MEIGQETEVKRTLGESGYVGLFHNLSDGQILDVRRQDRSPMYQKDLDIVQEVLDLYYPNWDTLSLSRKGARSFQFQVVGD